MLFTELFDLHHYLAFVAGDRDHLRKNLVVQGPVSRESVKSDLTCGTFAAYFSLFLGNNLLYLVVALLCYRFLLIDIAIDIDEVDYPGVLFLRRRCQLSMQVKRVPALADCHLHPCPSRCCFTFVLGGRKLVARHESTLLWHKVGLQMLGSRIVIG